MLILYFTGVILSKKCQGEGLKKVLKKGERGDLPYKGGFLKKGGLNLRAMHQGRFSKKGWIKPARNASKRKL